MNSKSTYKRFADAAVAVIVDEQRRVLISQRLANDSFGGFWEFPGGGREEGETLEACVVRELLEELAIGIEVREPLTMIEFDYPDAIVRLHPFICRHISGSVTRIECQDARWVEPQALRDYQFPPANTSLIEEIIAHLSARP